MLPTARSFALRPDGGDCDATRGIVGRDDEIIEDAALDVANSSPRRRRCCCFCFPSFRCRCFCTSARDLFDKDKRLLRAIFLVVVLLNVPIGKYILYPFTLFSTWIHESFHGLAALSVGGRVLWLNVYPNGSGLAHTMIPRGKFARAWVAGAGYQGTAIVGGIMLMFRRSTRVVRVGTCGVGIVMLLSCALLVRNAFGLLVLLLMGVGLAGAGWKLSPFWVSELYAVMSATTCLNAITSVRTLFLVTEANIGGVTRSSDAITMQDFLFVPYWIWASVWMALALLMSALGVLIVVETEEGNSGGNAEGHLLAMETELT